MIQLFHVIPKDSGLKGKIWEGIFLRPSTYCTACEAIGQRSEALVVEAYNNSGAGTQGFFVLVASLLLVVVPGVTSSVLVPSSDALCY